LGTSAPPRFWAAFSLLPPGREGPTEDAGFEPEVRA